MKNPFTVSLLWSFYFFTVMSVITFYQAADSWEKHKEVMVDGKSTPRKSVVYAV